MKIKKHKILITTIFLTILFFTKIDIIYSQTLQFGQIKFNASEENPRPDFVIPLAGFLETRTSLFVSPQINVFSAEQHEIFNYPLLFATGVQEFSPLNSKQRINIEKFLKFGGTIFVDDLMGNPKNGFGKSIADEFKTIFPNYKIENIGNDEVIFRSFFILNQSYGRVVRNKKLKGLKIDGRWAVIISENDILGGISQDIFGNWTYDVHGKNNSRKMSFRLLTNVIMYALCEDYKEDALHIDYILQRRRLP